MAVRLDVDPERRLANLRDADPDRGDALHPNIEIDHVRAAWQVVQAERAVEHATLGGPDPKPQDRRLGPALRWAEPQLDSVGHAPIRARPDHPVDVYRVGLTEGVPVGSQHQPPVRAVVASLVTAVVTALPGPQGQAEGEDQATPVRSADREEAGLASVRGRATAGERGRGRGPQDP